MTPEFKNAKLYTCRDGEYITNTDWPEAIVEQLESDWEEDETIEEQCNRIGPITVHAYAPDEVSDSWISSQVDLLMARFKEDFDEAYGHPDFEAEPWADDGDWFKKVCVANLTKSLRNAKISACHEVAKHTFTVAECIRIGT